MMNEAVHRIPGVIGIDLQVKFHVFHLHLVELCWRILWWAKATLQAVAKSVPSGGGGALLSHAFWHWFQKCTLRRGFSSE